MDTKEIVAKYLKYHAGEAFLFGKGTFSENKWIWYAKAKDEYTTAEVIKENEKSLVVRTPEGEEKVYLTNPRLISH
jgi:hypothetical protein